MSALPLFSIILPSYNRPALLAKAIASVIGQRYGGWELIIIDDGSAVDKRLDPTTITDPRIQYYWQANAGKGAARNHGLSKAKAPYICFLDDDDQYLPNHLSIFQQAIKAKPEVQIFKTGAQSIENGKRVFESSYITALSEKDQVAFLLKNYFGLLDLCIKQSLLADHHFEDYALWQDKFFLLPLLQRSRVHQLNHRTVQINEHEQRSVNLAYKKLATISDQLDAIKAAFDQFNLTEQYNFPKSFRDDILIKILCTHFYHAKKYEGSKAAWQLARKMYSLHPSPKLIAQFMKYQIST